MLDYSLHTHTKGFDGMNSVEDMACCARELGWDKIGISNHFIVYPTIEETNMYKASKRIGYSQIYSVSFECALQKFKDNFEQIDRVREKTGFPIYKGMEVDFFDSPEWKRGFEKACAVLNPDYIIGSAHFVEMNGSLMNMHDILKLTDSQRDAVISKYFHNVRQDVRYGVFDFMAHLDLLKRKKIGIEEKWIDEENKTIDVISEKGMFVEINTAQLKHTEEPNPSLRIIRGLSDAGVQMFLSDDAHCTEHLAQCYEQVERLLDQNGFSFCKKPIVVGKHQFFKNLLIRNERER